MSTTLDIRLLERSPDLQGSSKKAARASIPTSVANLVKTVIGSGVLSLAEGVGILSSNRNCLLPANLVTIFFGLVSGYSFLLVSKACDATDTVDFTRAWSKAVGSNSKWIVDAVTVGMCILAMISYQMILGDSFLSFLHFAGVDEESTTVTRSTVILAFSLVVLLPLSLLKSLEKLGFTSILGLLGTFWTAYVMLLRYMDGSYEEDGRFYEGLEEKYVPVFDDTDSIFSAKILTLVAVLGTAYCGHVSSGKLYAELQDRSLPRMTVVVSSAYAVCIGLVMAYMNFGYLTFGGASNGYILNNYNTKDGLAISCRLAVGFVVTFTYPLMTLPCRESIFKLSGLNHNDTLLRSIATVLLLAGSTTTAILTKDLGLIVGYAGAFFGSMLVYIMPGLMYGMVCGKLRRDGNESIWLKIEQALSYMIVVMGIVVMVLGCAVLSMEAAHPHDPHPEHE